MAYSIHSCEVEPAAPSWEIRRDQKAKATFSPKSWQELAVLTFEIGGRICGGGPVHEYLALQSSSRQSRSAFFPLRHDDTIEDFVRSLLPEATLSPHIPPSSWINHNMTS